MTYVKNKITIRNHHMKIFKSLRGCIDDHKYFDLLLIVVVIIGISDRSVAYGQDAGGEIPKTKQTTPGLYVNAREAYDKWKTDSVNIIILDVRTPEEYIYIGHPPMAWNIPFLLQTYKWDEGKNHFSMKPNPDFVSGIRQIASTNDTILVACRSGGRSAMAVNKLAEEGFKNVYSITDGIEGDLVTDPESVFKGQRLLNGWKNSGLPWTYTIQPALMILPAGK